jgi:hypothetical protein
VNQLTLPGFLIRYSCLVVDRHTCPQTHIGDALSGVYTMAIANEGSSSGSQSKPVGKLWRLLTSRHIRDLQVITVVAALGVGTLLYLWGYLLLDSSTDRRNLDDLLDHFYVSASCLGLQNLPPDKLTDVRKVQENLAAARSKVQMVNEYIWGHIDRPINSMGDQIKNLEQTVGIKESNFYDFNRYCQAWKFYDFNTDRDGILPKYLSAARHLTLALSTADVTWSGLAFIAAFGTAVLGFGGWLYRTADARLTVVDVIASEMFSVVRAAGNNKSVAKLMSLDDAKCVGMFAFLELTEQYNDFMKAVGRDLGFLDQYTVTRISGYYTSLKIMQDRVRMLRNWANWLLKSGRTTEEILVGKEEQFLHESVKQIMYDFYLCLENARISLHELLENGEFHDNCIFVCLISEIRAFAFLRKHYGQTEYIGMRLEKRLEVANGRSFEALESYLREEYAIGVARLRGMYENYYPDHFGMDIITAIEQGRPADRSLSWKELIKGLVQMGNRVEGT